MKSFLILPALASLATAHFDVVFPEWRGDSFADTASQYIYPCANVSQENANRTLWPLDGGSVILNLHHKWSYYAINLGIDIDNVAPSFTTLLTPELHNATGNGTLCIPKLSVPAGLAKEGANASLQFVTFDNRGSSLYNCADITFSAKAVNPSAEECKTDGVKVDIIKPDASKTCEDTNTPTTTGANAATSSNAAAGVFRSGEGKVAGALVGVLAVVFSVLI